MRLTLRQTKCSLRLVGIRHYLLAVAAHLIDGAAGYVSIKKGAMWWFEVRERNGVAQTALKGMVTAEMLLGK